MKNYLLLLMFSVSFSAFCQNDKEVKEIIKDYDLKLLAKKSLEFKEIERREKSVAYKFAEENNIPTNYSDKNGNLFQLVKLLPNNYPIYIATENQAAARATRATQLNTGGSLGLTLNGQGMVARVWDGGKVRTQHNHFGTRVTSIDDPGTTYNFHGTHVAGTILANGAASVRGMAYEATGRTFDWTDDDSEAISEATLGMLISNHSYGIPVTNNGTTLPDWFIGTYDEGARTWDEIAYLAPYYLMVASAGNSGTDENNTNPISFGYDKLTGDKTAKNNLVIANAEDVTVDTNGNLTSTLIMNSSSSQGPTDDRRIKPDITGNGTALFSTGSNSNTATQTLTGTSMSSPNVAGTLLLLQQHYKNLTTNFMRSATLKGLACHTADDGGNFGPDAIFGWGLLNAKAAAQAITNNGLNAWVSEESLNNNQTFTMTVKSLGTAPLAVTACWTDVPGEPNNGERGANDTKRALVNDLDVRITRNTTTYFPWRLDNDPNNLALRTGDNNADNVEQVKIDAPVAGDYTITITHKNALVNNKQDFSLIITGISSGFALVPTSNDVEICAPSNAVYTFNYSQTGTATTNFTATGIPAGATASFSPASRNSNGLVTMTISNLAAANGGLYNVGIVGNNGIESETRLKKLKLFKNAFNPVTLTSPTNNQNTVATTVNLTWQQDANAESYKVEYASNAGFSPIINTFDTAETSQIISNLNEETNYYWRVTPSNRCGTALTSTAAVRTFQTGVLSCGNVFTATDFSNNVIATTNAGLAIIPVEITGGLTIGDLNIELDISHSYIEEANVKLQGPASIGSPLITLFNGVCDGNDNIVCIVDDSGLPFTCGTSPAISGTVQPQQTLTSLNGLPANGTWNLIVSDNVNGDGGTVNAFKITVCNIQTPLSSGSFELDSIAIYPNPSKDFITVNLGNLNLENTEVELFDIQGRKVLSQKMNTSIENINVSNLTDGVYLITISKENAKTTKKIIVKK